MSSFNFPHPSVRIHSSLTHFSFFYANIKSSSSLNNFPTYRNQLSCIMLVYSSSVFLSSLIHPPLVIPASFATISSPPPSPPPFPDLHYTFVHCWGINNKLLLSDFCSIPDLAFVLQGIRKGNGWGGGGGDRHFHFVVMGLEDTRPVAGIRRLGLDECPRGKGEGQSL